MVRPSGGTRCQNGFENLSHETDLSFPFVVLPRPSVILSPITTNALVSFGDHASTALKKNLWKKSKKPSVRPNTPSSQNDTKHSPMINPCRPLYLFQILHPNMVPLHKPRCRPTSGMRRNTIRLLPLCQIHRNTNRCLRLYIQLNHIGNG